ncbi:hypothetical protein [Leeuwenhoekiella nanhaiensis]|uniref:Uncharacterized protein n=1 Tax=Leeuwenhoekiella nanhaiensis TaxID=1655491 RepID=A0A2G1VLR5_9FLAO|nr:hypothetical protein [Leeuwenhoekiella nanhaiensis]PHQ27698.1 hypothetical protein CJ305_18705 [Leeuwenhoekiella nanhaiensis]
MENDKSQTPSPWSSIPAFFAWIKTLPKIAQVFLAGAIVLLVGIWIMKNTIDKVIDQSFERRDVEIEIQRERERLNDSINKVKAAQFWKQSLDDELEIRDICQRYERYFEGETQISLFKLHDHGDPLAPENNPMVTVKWSSLSEIQDSYQSEPVYTGALWMLRETLQNDFVYVPDVTQVDNYWKGREKAFHESIGSKSTAFIYIKETNSSRWFIAIHWNISNPYANEDLIRLQMERFANLIKPLIYDVPEHLKNR